LAGPKKETVAGEPLRVRGKASSDGAVGWLTAKDHKGVVFAEASSKYYLCTQSVAMTDAKDVKTCNVLRKLNVGEIFLASQEPEVDESAGVTRLEGTAVKDDKAGWITIKGNAGTVYAERSAKHYITCREVSLQKRFISLGAESVRTLAKGEAVEVLEGPKAEKFEPVVRMKGKAADGAVGWLTMKGNNMRPWTPFYKCLKATPLRESRDGAGEDAKVTRQLEQGEVVECLEGPSYEPEVKEIRIRAKADKDGAVGWVTVKDEKGTKVLGPRPAA